MNSECSVLICDHPVLCAGRGVHAASRCNMLTSMWGAVQGWTDLMYWLSDAEYKLSARAFSLAIVFLLSFLGLQLFTSVLCNYSMEVKYVAARARACAHMWVACGRHIRNAVRCRAESSRQTTRSARLRFKRRSRCCGASAPSSGGR
jgi:hypothetical protein